MHFAIFRALKMKLSAGELVRRSGHMNNMIHSVFHVTENTQNDIISELQFFILLKYLVLYGYSSKQMLF